MHIATPERLVLARAELRKAVEARRPVVGLLRDPHLIPTDRSIGGITEKHRVMRVEQQLSPVRVRHPILEQPNELLGTARVKTRVQLIGQ